MLVSQLRHRFRAMGTQVELHAPEDADATTFATASEVVERVFREDEARASRFRADSELSRANATAGRPVELTRELADLVGFALDAAARTDGLFDPTVLGALMAAGYDRDFDELIAGARAALHPVTPCGRWREVTLDDRVLRLPEGVGLDLGGVAKGWAVDRAASAAVTAGLAWALVTAGGDLRMAGDAPALAVDIEDPESLGTACLRLSLADGAIASSSVTRRRWGTDAHHLIDPRTARPAAGPVLQATAWAATCAEAEIRSKVLLLAGPDALAHLPGVLVTVDGPILTNLDGIPGDVAA